MSLTVRELPKAKQDKRSIFRWLDERSPAGAAAWLDAYDALIERLKQDAPSFGKAPESQDCDFEVSQGLFKTRRGRVYRALFFIEGQDVYILRVRGPGQAPVTPEDIK
jgi:plasmid stabilization system protein ParE